jgi:penicillin-binding protein 1A
MAMLAGLPKAPSKYNPVVNPSRALTRRNWIIGRMHELGYISQAQRDEATNSPVGINLYQEKLDVNMPYLAEMTRSALVDRYGEQVMNGGWRVRLTVDSEAQVAAEAAILTGLVAYEHRHGWRGAEANDEPLENFSRYSSMSPAKVTKVNSRSFEATMLSGESVTVNWSGMSWARKYFSADRIGYYPDNAAQIVSKNDIIRVIPNR